MPRRGGENEAARLQTGHCIDPAGVMSRQALDEGAESPPIGQQRSNVPEQDPGLGEVRHLAEVIHDELGQLGRQGGAIRHERLFFLFGCAETPR